MNYDSVENMGMWWFHDVLFKQLIIFFSTLRSFLIGIGGIDLLGGNSGTDITRLGGAGNDRCSQCALKVDVCKISNLVHLQGTDEARTGADRN